MAVTNAYHWGDNNSDRKKTSKINENVVGPIVHRFITLSIKRKWLLPVQQIAVLQHTHMSVLRYIERVCVPLMFRDFVLVIKVKKDSTPVIIDCPLSDSVLIRNDNTLRRLYTQSWRKNRHKKSVNE